MLVALLLLHHTSALRCSLRESLLAGSRDLNLQNSTTLNASAMLANFSLLKVQELSGALQLTSWRATGSDHS